MEWFVFLNGRVEGPLTADYIGRTYAHDEEALIWGASQLVWLNFNEWSNYLTSTGLDLALTDSPQSRGAGEASSSQDYPSSSLENISEFDNSDGIMVAESLGDLDHEEESTDILESEDVLSSQNPEGTELSTIEVTRGRSSLSETESDGDGATAIESLENLEGNQEEGVLASESSSETGSDGDGATAIESLENLEGNQEEGALASESSSETGSDGDGATAIESLENLEGDQEPSEDVSFGIIFRNSDGDGATAIESLGI